MSWEEELVANVRRFVNLDKTGFLAFSCWVSFGMNCGGE